MKRRLSRELAGLLLIAGALTAPLFASAAAYAQAYPSKPVRLLVPFAAGGDIDPIARLLADHLQTAWGQPVIVETRPGAGGTLGSEAVAKSPADGYMLLMCSAGPITISPSLYAKLNYAPDKDFDPVALVGYAALVMLTNDSLPVKTYGEYVALAKSKPDTITYATAGVGSLAHLTTLAYSGDAGLKIVHVPYKGSGPAVQDLIGGHVNSSFNPMPSALTAMGSGKVRPLAVTSQQRSKLLPDVPTLAELGLKDFDVTSWYGICAPAGTPKDVIQKVHAEVAKATSSPAFQEKLSKLGTETRIASVEDVAKLIKVDADRWAKVISTNNIPKITN